MSANAVPLAVTISCAIVGAAAYHSITILPLLVHLTIRGPTPMKILSVACVCFGLIRLSLQLLQIVDPVRESFPAIDGLSSWSSYFAFFCSDTILYLRARPFIGKRLKWVITLIYLVTISAKAFFYLVVGMVFDYPLNIGIDSEGEIRIVNYGFAAVDTLSNVSLSAIFIWHLIQSRSRLEDLGLTTVTYINIVKLTHIASQYALYGLGGAVVSRLLRATIVDPDTSAIFLNIALAIEFNNSPSMIIAMNETLRHPAPVIDPAGPVRRQATEEIPMAQTERVDSNLRSDTGKSEPENVTGEDTV